MAYVVMAYLVMAYVVMAYVVMAYGVMAYVVRQVWRRYHVRARVQPRAVVNHTSIVPAIITWAITI